MLGGQVQPVRLDGQGRNRRARECQYINSRRRPLIVVCQFHSGVLFEQIHCHASIRPSGNETEVGCDPVNPNNSATEADSRSIRTIFFSTASGNRAANAGHDPISGSMMIQQAVCACLRPEVRFRLIKILGFPISADRLLWCYSDNTEVFDGNQDAGLKPEAAQTVQLEKRQSESTSS